MTQWKSIRVYLSIIITNFYLSLKLLSWSVDVDEVIDMAKRKLEKERELYMSKSLPGFTADNQATNDNENDNENDNNDEANDSDDEDEDSDESEEKGLTNWLILNTFVAIN